jgi:hypothetical protein
MDILRERILAAAVNDGEENIVQAMLALGVDPRERIAIDMDKFREPSFPLQLALSHRHFLSLKLLPYTFPKRRRDQS